jgi:type IV secretion system protein VirB1
MQQPVGILMPIFEVWATACAPAVALELLAGIAQVESSLRPMAFRDGTEMAVVRSAGEGVAAAAGALDQGREIGVGLFGISDQNARSAGLSIADAFEPCNNFRIAEAVFKAERLAAEKRGVDIGLWDRVAVRSWWRPDGRFVSGGAYEAAVTATRDRLKDLLKTEIPGRLLAVEQSAGERSAPAAPSEPVARAGRRQPPQRADQRDIAAETPPAAAATWDVFGRAKSSGVLVYQRRD